MGREVIARGLGKLMLLGALAAASAALPACGGGPTTPPPDENGFDDHTKPRATTREEFFALAVQGGGRQATKFVITQFGEAASRALWIMDGHHYTLHDEWYWFRLLNGHRVAGDDTEPVTGLSFPDIRAIYAWAKVQQRLPLDLAMDEESGRLYSWKFYQAALGKGRKFGVGTILYVPARTSPEPREEIWGWELEYSDVVTPEELATFFEMVDAGLPEGVRGKVKWVVRSPAQEQLAKKLETEKLPYWDRILRYEQLVTKGEVEVYSAGLTAGQVKVVHKGDINTLVHANETDILVLEELPDYLPPCAAVITALPQTEFSHINFLAKNRKIANVYLGGALEDPRIEQLDNAFAFAIVRATLDGKLEIVTITMAEFVTWRSKLVSTATSARQVDVSKLPYTIDLRTLRIEQSGEMKPVIGGKATGFVGLLAPGTTTMPDAPLSITVRAYAEHVEPMIPAIQALLADPMFNASARIRYLALEGRGDYDLRYSTPADVRARDAFIGAHSSTTAIGGLLAAGGVKAALRARPIAPATLEEITRAVAIQFQTFASTQGLRFRSSSTIEDVEGFNGAGIYDSNTGFLDPLAQPDPSDQDETVEKAIKKTWASYWSSEAFEERRRENVNHLSGYMAVVVHARFDDEKEKSNGVHTFTIMPPGFADRAVMEVNVQKGALSVTNPDPRSTALPEYDRVHERAAGGDLVIERVRSSSLVEPGVPLLTDAQLREMFEQTKRIAERWMANANAPLEPAQAGRTLTLDLEFREVQTGWPQLASGEVRPSRVVIKQARSLEPGLRKLSQELKAMPFPRDVLGRANRVERRSCYLDRFIVSVGEAWTDPLIAPNLGHDVDPFVGSLKVELFRGPIPELGLPQGARMPLTHLDLASVAYQPPNAAGKRAFEATLTMEAAARHGIARVSYDGDARYTLATATASVAGTVERACTQETMFVSAQSYLLELLAR